MTKKIFSVDRRHPEDDVYYTSDLEDAKRVAAERSVRLSKFIRVLDHGFMVPKSAADLAELLNQAQGEDLILDSKVKVVAVFDKGVELDDE